MELIISTRKNSSMVYKVVIQLANTWNTKLEMYKPVNEVHKSGKLNPRVLSLPVPDNITAKSLLEAGLLLGNLKTGVTIIP